MTNEDIPEIQSIWDDARGYIDRGNYDKAIEIYQYILIRYSDDPIAVEHANAYLGDISLTLRQLDTAEEHIKKAISFSPEKPGYHYILGFIYSIERRWNKAIPEFETAVKKEPDNGEYLRGLAWAIYSSGDVAKGLAFLEKASRLAPAKILVETGKGTSHHASVNLVNQGIKVKDRQVNSILNCPRILLPQFR